MAEYPGSSERWNPKIEVLMKVFTEVTSSRKVSQILFFIFLYQTKVNSPILEFSHHFVSSTRYPIPNTIYSRFIFLLERRSSLSLILLWKP